MKAATWNIERSNMHEEYNFPLDGLPSIDELNNLLQNMMESGGNFVNSMMKIYSDKKLVPDFNGMSPDTYGCERFFVDFSIFL